MSDGDAARARMTTIIALLMTVMLIGIPASPLVKMLGPEVSPIGDASAFGEGDRTIRIGYQNFQSNLATLNPLIYTMGEEMDLIWPCYSSLLQHDLDLNVVGDLATWWEVSTNGTLYHFKITSYAKFYNRMDPTAVHPLTVHDIIFTYYLVQNNSNNLQSYFPKVNDQYVISRMWAVNNFEFYIETTRPYAPMFEALTSIPILPQYIWEGKKVSWANYDIRSNIPPCVGSGPFYYVLDGLPSAGTAELDRNPGWFATEERGWQVHVSKVIFKSETSVDSALADLEAGDIDIDGFPSSVQYLNALPYIDGVDQWNPVTNAVYEFNMNQMSNAQRAALGGTYKSGSSNQLLLDPVIKRAMMMCIDREGWVSGFLDGLGEPADSLVGPANRFHYDYGSREGETPIPFDPAGARDLLNANGWIYDLDGHENTEATPLCKAGGSDPLRFRFYTLLDGLDESLWGTGALMIIDWMEDAGIDLRTYYGQKSMSFMNGAWAAADYDVWLWDWWFSLMAEASLDLMSVLTTVAIGTWSDVYWHNATFDRLYNESLFQTDFATRYATLADMQALAYVHSGCVPVAYRADLFAATDKGNDHWTNWGNWTQQSLLRPDQTLPWLYMRISPDAGQGENPAPKITSMPPTYPGQVNVSIDFAASATDDDTMVYRWFFGDGTKTGWLSDPAIGHAYAKDGYYTAWLAVREAGTLDNFTTVAKTVVEVKDLSNYAPTGVDFTYSPGDPDSGTVVYLNATATDPNGDPMSFSWDFGDGHTATGQRVTHQFTAGLLSYTVTLNVDDGHLGTGDRPVPKHYLVPVTNNSKPSCTVPSYPHVVWKTWTDFTVTSTDADLRDNHRYTWLWGDGGCNVTNNQKTATYSYSRKASYVLTVYADDLTGLPGHNVSGQNNVLVTGTNTAPLIDGFTVSTNSPSVGQIVNFTAQARDADGDLLWYTFDFGDGDIGYVSGVATPSVPLSLSMDHYYSAEGTYSAYIYVTDNYSIPLQSSPQSMDAVLRNSPPEVTSVLSEIRASPGFNLSFLATATDPDGDSLEYTWDFGDLSPLLVGSSQHHAWADDGAFVYRVYVDDSSGLVGHNVSILAWAYIQVLDLPLVTGWNLVTVPYTGYGYKASTLGLKPNDIVTGYNPVTSAYDKYYIVGNPFGNFDIIPGMGYWIFVSSNETLHLNGSIPTTAQTIPLTVKAGGNWAIVGLNSLKTTFKASSLRSMASGPGTIMTVASFDPVTKRYNSWVYGGPPPTDFSLVPGNAYWVYCTGNVTLTYTP